MTAKLLHNTPSLMGGVPAGPYDIGDKASTRAVAAKMETAGVGSRGGAWSEP